jgi:hypothetical protein
MIYLPLGLFPYFPETAFNIMITINVILVQSYFVIVVVFDMVNSACAS